MKNQIFSAVRSLVKTRPILLASTVLVALASSATFPQRAQAEIPMEVRAVKGGYLLEVSEPSGGRSGLMNSAYGDRLRLYDVHMAKIFRETYDMCSRMAHDNGVMTWRYKTPTPPPEAGRSKPFINIILPIPCRVATELVVKYGIEGSSPAEDKVDEWMLITDEMWQVIISQQL
jgi:hypothetical protein